MITTLIFLSVLLAVSSSTDLSEWESFKVQHGKSYKNIREDSLRHAIFKQNFEKINKHNEKFQRGETTFTMGINQFADLNAEEFQRYLGYQTHKKREQYSKNIYFVSNPDIVVPLYVNWTQDGAVSNIKDQGDCGSCWSFSAVGSLEGQYYKKTGQLVSFSAQNLVDCDRVCDGCGGGYVDYAMQYIEERGIMTEKNYPYSGWNAICKTNDNSSVVKINSFVYVKEFEEIDLMNAVATIGPVSVAIHATDQFQFYKSGILNDSQCQNGLYDLNHAVLTVGYGSDNGKDYWIVKNSWSERWGEYGYIRMSRNAKNQCGIATQPIYPVL